MRNVLLKIHLWFGLTAAIFLVILGLTGSIMAFEGDIDHWLHPTLWYVAVSAHTLPEAELIGKVDRQFAPAQVSAVEFPRQPNLAEMMHLTDRSAVLVNPYDGSILGRVMRPTNTQKVLGFIHQLHLRLAPDPRWPIAPVGKKIISYAGLILCLQVPTGIMLWLRAKRTSIRWNASWFRICFDAHLAMGIYASVFLWIAAFTGVLIGFDFAEAAIYSITHSSKPSSLQPPPSTPVQGATPINVDHAIRVARQALPAAALDGVFLPLNPKATFTFVMRVPEETSGIAHSTVSIDQYSGAVLQVHDFMTDSPGYRWIRFNRSIHTGDIWGAPGHILVSLSSLLLVFLVVTGTVIWWKKAAVHGG